MRFNILLFLFIIFSITYVSGDALLYRFEEGSGTTINDAGGTFDGCTGSGCDGINSIVASTNPISWTSSYVPTFGNGSVTGSYSMLSTYRNSGGVALPSGLNFTGSYTISYFAYSIDYDSLGSHVFTVKGIPTEYNIEADGYAGKLQYAHSGGTPSFTSNFLTNWDHYTHVKNADTNEFITYINGVEDNTINYPDNTNVNIGEGIMIGHANMTDDRSHFALDNFYFIDSILSSSQINSIYQDGTYPGILTGDSIAPTVTLNKPLNINYTTNNISVNVSMTDDNPDSCWVSVNGTDYSLSGSGLTFTGYITPPNGNYTLYAYCNDTFGNVGDADVSLNVYPLFNIIKPNTSSYSNNYIDIKLSSIRNNLSCNVSYSNNIKSIPYNTSYYETDYLIGNGEYVITFQCSRTNEYLSIDRTLTVSGYDINIISPGETSNNNVQFNINPTLEYSDCSLAVDDSIYTFPSDQYTDPITLFLNEGSYTVYISCSHRYISTTANHDFTVNVDTTPTGEVINYSNSFSVNQCPTHSLGVAIAFIIFIMITLGMFAIGLILYSPYFIFISGILLLFLSFPMFGCNIAIGSIFVFISFLLIYVSGSMDL